jgi:geranylgeranyl diphosphate synthase type I
VATLSGATDEVALGLDEYGKLTGMGFQIHDDVLDLTASQKVLGKRQGGDIAEGKKTMIMIHAMENGIQLKAFGKQEASEQEIEEALEVLKESGSINYAKKRAEHLVDQGKKALDVLPDTTAKKLLLNLADYMIKRGY